MNAADNCDAVDRIVQRCGRGTVLENYIIPGLRSTLLGLTAAGGKMRLFEMTRDQELTVVPHDHRYSFDCFVINGVVENAVYRPKPFRMPDEVTHLEVPYNPVTRTICIDRGIGNRYEREITRYMAGSWYAMDAEAFHSIWFLKGTKVLFIESKPTVRAESHCLLPVVNGEVLDTFMWRDWMMKAGE